MLLRSSWYYIVGDDTYLGPKFKRIKINESMYPNRALGGNFTWSSGAWGWFLSNPVAKACAVGSILGVGGPC